MKAGTCVTKLCEKINDKVEKHFQFMSQRTNLPLYKEVLEINMKRPTTKKEKILSKG